MIQPLNDRIVVKIVEPPPVRGALVIPETAKSAPTTGEVLAVGPGRRDKKGERVPMRLNVGDKVLFDRFAGDGDVDENTRMMREQDIIAVVEVAAA